MLHVPYSHISYYKNSGNLKTHDYSTNHTLIDSDIVYNPSTKRIFIISIDDR